MGRPGLCSMPLHSLDVGDLLADALQLVLQLDYVLRNREVVCLAADGVNFAADFLQDKLRLPADLTARLEQRAELVKMAI